MAITKCLRYGRDCQIQVFRNSSDCYTHRVDFNALLMVKQPFHETGFVNKNCLFSFFRKYIYQVSDIVQDIRNR